MIRYFKTGRSLICIVLCFALTFSFLTASSSLESDQVLEAKVTFTKGQPMDQVIKKLESIFNLRFTYKSALLKDKVLKKEITVTEMNLEVSIREIFTDNGTSLKKVNDQLYVITKNYSSELDSNFNPEVISKRVTIKTLVSGNVYDEQNIALIGVNVYEKGIPSNGVTTDLDGSYSVSVNDENAILIFSYLGYQTKEIKIGNQSVLNVQMETSSSLLQEVVVTAMGIEKDEKLLTSNVQALQAQDIVRGGREDIIGALEGKVSGVQISSTSGAPGASTEIILRGATSVDGNNQPLFVVDGIAISNASASGTMNRASDINPNDIASVSVLKGASAAALYGIDAANGAIIITTKSGQKGKVKVGFNSYYGLSEVTNLHDQQNHFTTGYSGTFNPTTFSHWGPQYRKSDEVYNNVEDFFKTGSTFKADLNLSGGTDAMTYYMSGSNLTDLGIVPNTDYTKRSVLLKVGSKLSEKLKVETTINSIYTNNNYGIVGASGGWLSTVYGWPRWDNMSEYLNPDGSERNLYTPVSGDLSTVPDNPWWTAYNKVRNDVMNRVLGNIHLTYDVSKWFKLDYRVGRDFYNQHYKSVSQWGSSGSSYEGAITEFDRNSVKWTSTLLGIMDYSFYDDLNLNLVVGNNIQSDYAEQSIISGTQFRNPDLHSINNLKDIKNSQFTGRRRVVGAFADVKLDYKRTFIVGVTVRNDWSSTLPEVNRSFFYPSYSAGFIFSELFPTTAQKYLSFGKIRASYSEVGKDAPPHKLTQVLEQYLGPDGGWKNGAFAGNPSLRPEITKELEVGIDLRFFQGRIGLDATYYSRESNDQIITPRVTPVTGAILQTVNSGSVENKGIEFSLNLIPIEKDAFTWKLSMNAFGNRSKLTKLFGDLVEFPVTYGQVSSIAIASSRLGEPLFSIIGTDYMRTDNGQVIIDNKGYPIVDSEKKYLGNREPNVWYGLVNTFTIGRDFEFSFQLDGALGADILNATGAGLIQRGLHTMTEDYRRREFVFEGVVEDENGGFSTNTQSVLLDREYFTSNYGVVGSNFVESVDWLRLRNVELSYFLPTDLLQKISISELALNLNLSNLILLSNYSGGDPQVNNAGPNGGGASGAGTMGVDYYQVPARRGVSLGVNIKF